MRVQMTLKRREAYVEILEVLKRIDRRFIEKIPHGLIDFFEKNKSEEYYFKYDDKKTLKEQNLNDITLSLLAMLNLNYWCEDEEHKEELLKLYVENEKRYQDELSEKHDLDNIFKKNNIENDLKENIIQEKVALTDYRESIFKKIINKIKAIFYKN